MQQLGLLGHCNPHTIDLEASSVILCVRISVTSQAQLATITSSYFFYNKVPTELTI